MFSFSQLCRPFSNPSFFLILSSWQAVASRANSRDNIARASRSNIRRSLHNSGHININSLCELPTELLAISELVLGAKTTEAEICIAGLLALGVGLGGLGDERTALDGVHEDVAGFEVWVMRPGSGVLDDAAAGS